MGPRGRDSNRRAFDPAEITGYEEAWDLLNAPADEAPTNLRDWVYERALSDIGLPPGHPGLLAP
jgi:hypothetical protein